MYVRVQMELFANGKVTICNSLLFCVGIGMLDRNFHLYMNKHSTLTRTIHFNKSGSPLPRQKWHSLFITACWLNQIISIYIRSRAYTECRSTNNNQWFCNVFESSPALWCSTIQIRDTLLKQHLFIYSLENIIEALHIRPTDMNFDVIVVFQLSHFVC